MSLCQTHTNYTQSSNFRAIKDNNQSQNKKWEFPSPIIRLFQSGRMELHHPATKQLPAAQALITALMMATSGSWKVDKLEGGQGWGMLAVEKATLSSHHHGKSGKNGRLFEG